MNQIKKAVQAVTLKRPLAFLLGAIPIQIGTTILKKKKTDTWTVSPY
jgi:hypothetical protein